MASHQDGTMRRSDDTPKPLENADVWPVRMVAVVIQQFWLLEKRKPVLRMDWNKRQVTMNEMVRWKVFVSMNEIDVLWYRTVYMSKTFLLWRTFVVGNVRYAQHTRVEQSLCVVRIFRTQKKAMNLALERTSCVKGLGVGFSLWRSVKVSFGRSDKLLCLCQMLEMIRDSVL